MLNSSSPTPAYGNSPKYIFNIDKLQEYKNYYIGLYEPLMLNSQNYLNPYSVANLEELEFTKGDGEGDKDFYFTKIDGNRVRVPENYIKPV